MSFEVEGKLHKVFPVENKSGSFQAREFVIEVESGQFPLFVKFQLVQDRCALIDDYSEGETIKVSFDLRGREWQGKYFTNLNAWRLDRPAKAEKSSAPKASAEDDGFFPSAGDERSSGGGGGNSRDMDDLPF